MTPLDAALHYAARGWRIVPIPPGEKFPRGVERWQTKATVDVDRITSWWTRHPDHGVGIATGAASGLFVVDVDPRHGGDETLADLEHEHGQLPDTVQCLTGGGGLHLYFRTPTDAEIRNDQAGRLGPGLDVRGEGGQVLAPPTIHPNGAPYLWEIEHDPLDGIAIAPAPSWLLALLTERHAPPQPRRTTSGGTTLGNARPGDRFEAETQWADLLGDDGWTLHSPRRGRDGDYELWTRPGKNPSDGASASLYYAGSDVLKVFTSSVPGLTPDATYTRFGYFAATRHGGDHGLASAELARRYAVSESKKPMIDQVTPGAPSPERPVIIHNGRQLDDVTRETIAALALANDPPHVFVRGGLLTRVRDDEGHRPIVEPLTKDSARHRLAEIADWRRLNADGTTRSTAPPPDIVANVLAADAWPYPALAGIATVPVLRPDGTFRTAHGYDHDTRLYHWTTDTYPDIVDTPTTEQLADAVATIDDTICDFPFDTVADRANAWALILTGIVRPAIDGQVPMALLDAPEPGTGKSLLARIAALIATGRTGAMQAMPRQDEELEKRITALLLGGTTSVIFDNVDGTIESPVLAGALTADVWSGRILGQSTTVEVPSRVTWLATGNNISVGGDLARRCYRIRLDAHQAQPWRRTNFRHADLEGHVRRHRAEIVAALCTIVRSWWASGRPTDDGLPAMGGYAPWVRIVGGILSHAGICGFLANLEQFYADADSEANGWEAFLHAWHEAVESELVTVGEIVRRMSDPHSTFGAIQLVEAIPDDLSAAWGTPRFSKLLGRALLRRAGRHYGPDGLHVVRSALNRSKVVQWSVSTKSEGERGEPRANPAASTRRDGPNAGFAGFTPPQEDFFGYPQKSEKNRLGDTKPRKPREPRGQALDDEGLFG